jgi:hypothetical protein
MDNPLTEQDFMDMGRITGELMVERDKVQSAKRLLKYKMIKYLVLSKDWNQNGVDKVIDACFQIDDNETGRGITGTAKDIKDFGKFKGKGDD